MNYYQVTIAYKGTNYFGWQAQSIDTLHEEKPTIEGTILNCLKKIAKNQSTTISVASRTDGGVHAQGQVAKITTPFEIAPEKLLLGLNSLLPKDIRILECEISSKEYNTNKCSISKEYHYYFVASKIDNVATSDITYHFCCDGLHDLELLRSACQLFVGKHDFYNFSNRDKNVSTTTREIFYCDIHEADALPLAANMYYLKIIGEGFLKYMVRYIMGTILEVAKGNVTLDEIALYLEEHQEDKLSKKVKAKGLHLIKIES